MPLFADSMGGGTAEVERDGQQAVHAMGIPPALLMIVFIIVGWMMFRKVTKD